MQPHDWYSDTDPKALEVFLRRQREMTPSEKFAAVMEQTEMLFRLAEAGVRAQYPEADDREVFLRVAARHLDRATMLRVYGWAPEP